MANIIILDEHTANQIAAGEVVERPVSVVKELVENSLDAGADRIMVEIEDGGLTAIAVTDNGCGMIGEDLKLALQRHATSKIRCASDLSRINSLGFRGEALTSIAAVSRLSLTTRTHDTLTGARAEVEGGSLISIEPAGCPPGTTVSVKSLFYNTPARRKTMKSPSNEGALCGDIISRLAMARPEVAFELRVKGRRVFYSPGTGNLLDSITAVYGVNQCREMVVVNATEEGLAIYGMTGKPSLNRSTRSHITVIINGRYVRCPAVSGAVEEAYRTFLPQGRRPVAVISLSIGPELLDVNVHPAKLEVRLLGEEKVTGLVTRAIKDALRVRSIIPTTTSAESQLKNVQGQNHSQIVFNIESKPLERTGNRYIIEKTPVSGGEQSSRLQLRGQSITEMAGEEKVGYTSETKCLPVLNVLAQLYPTYILAGGVDGLYIIDQHAAHERILYEEFLAGQEKRPSQCLLAPVTLELDYREAAILTDRVLWFTDAGFVVEHFGGNTFLLRGVPLQLQPGQEKGFFLDMLDYFKERGAGASQVEFIDRLASSLACRNAVKSGEKLSQSSMDVLLQRLAGTENPYTCPHGRPTVIHLSYKDLEARFKR